MEDLAYCAPRGASIGGGGGGGGTEDFSANSTPNNRDFKNTVGWTFDVGGNLISQPFSPLKMHKMSQFFSQCLLMPSSGSWKPFLNQGKLLQLAPTQIYYVFISVCIIILVYFSYASSFEWCVCITISDHSINKGTYFLPFLYLSLRGHFFTWTWTKNVILRNNYPPHLGFWTTPI